MTGSQEYMDALKRTPAYQRAALRMASSAPLMARFVNMDGLEAEVAGLAAKSAARDTELASREKMAAEGFALRKAKLDYGAKAAASESAMARSARGEARTLGLANVAASGILGWQKRKAQKGVLDRMDSLSRILDEYEAAMSPKGGT